MEPRTTVVDGMQNRDESTLADQEPKRSLCPDDQRRRNTMQISNPNKGRRSTNMAHPSDAISEYFYFLTKTSLLHGHMAFIDRHTQAPGLSP